MPIHAKTEPGIGIQNMMTKNVYSDFPRDARPEYPDKSSDKFYVGTQLNKILRHYIGQEGKRETNKKPIKTADNLSRDMTLIYLPIMVSIVK